MILTSRSPTPETNEDLKFVEEIKRQWVATIDALVDPLMIVKEDYTISKANKALAKMKNTSVKDVLGKKCYEVFANRKSPCEGCRMLETSKGSHVENYNLEDVRGNRFYEVTSQPIFDADQKIDGVVQIYRDRTEAKQLQARLHQSDKLASIGLLAGGIAHEINNPLGGILVFSQMLMREISKDSPHYTDVCEIEAATQRCKKIVENLLEFARQRPPDDHDADAELVDIVDAAKAALNFARVSIKWSEVEIAENWELAKPTIHAERNKLIQVFLNLIQNGIQAMDNGGRLALSSYSGEHNGQPIGVFEISDTGCGIPERHLQRIFDPFYTTKDPGEGTGLGLAISFGIIEDLGGTMQVESTEGKGTCFRITLPLAESEPPELTRPA